MWNNPEVVQESIKKIKTGTEQPRLLSHFLIPFPNLDENNMLFHEIYLPYVHFSVSSIDILFQFVCVDNCVSFCRYASFPAVRREKYNDISNITDRIFIDVGGSANIESNIISI